jgi:hypothetical protein
MNFHNHVLKKSIEIVRHRARLILVFVLLVLLAVNAFRFFQIASAQNQIRVQTLPPTLFRVGERLTYNISFEKFNNAAYAEIYAVSRGKLGEKDAVEIHSKIKTSELVSAAFYLLDETRTTYASSDSGLPLYIRKTSNAGISPKETVDNFLVNPTAYNDLLTLVYQARNASGAGSFTLQEDGKIYNVVFQNTVGKRLKTAAGDNIEVQTDANNYTIQNMAVSKQNVRNWGAKKGGTADATPIEATPMVYPAPDNSEISSTMNNNVPTEIRTFKNNPMLIKMEKIFVDVKKPQIKVYLKNGKVVNVPPGKISNSATASADEILSAAGVASKPVPPKIEEKMEQKEQ